MIHTLMITHRIISSKVFDEIYKGLEKVSGVKPKKVGNGCYITAELRKVGFTNIQLTNKKVGSKYKYNLMQITIILNPVKLLMRNKLEIVTHEDLFDIKRLFNCRIKDIHESLPILDQWIVNRIDYAINIETPYVEQYIKLFHRSDKPKNFKELYCKTAKIRKQMNGSFYLFNKSVVVNFYNKEHERLSQNFNIDGAKNLLRLEVQCKKLKTNSIKVKNKFDSSCLIHYLSREISYQQLKYYYDKTIGQGDYYKLAQAIEIVNVTNYTSSTKNKLIEVLKEVNKHRSIWKAREKSKYSVSCFNNYLNKLRLIGINPVTIPERWGIKYLKNIIY